MIEREKMLTPDRSCILGIDPSISRWTGWCLLKGDRLAGYGRLDKEQAWDWSVRTQMLKQATVLAIEDQYMGVNAKVYGQLVAARELWAVPARDLYGLPVHLVPPSQWQRAISGDHRWTTKGMTVDWDAIFAYLRRRYKDQIIDLTKDQAAAIGVATYWQDANRIAATQSRLGA
jgi:Holliday junction resolvasome RuvABC endonuclease subunit